MKLRQILHQEADEIKSILEDLKDIKKMIEYRGIQIAEDRRRISRIEEIISAIVKRLQSALPSEELIEEVNQLRRNLAELKSTMEGEFISMEVALNTKISELTDMIDSMQSDLKEISEVVRTLRGYQWGTHNLVEALRININRHKEILDRLSGELEEVRKIAVSALHYVMREKST